MIKILVLLAALWTGAVHAQSVQQSGTVTPGHAAQWVTNGAIKDAGTAANGSLTSLGVTQSGSGICQNSALTTSAGYQQICLGVTTTGGGYLSVQNFGTAVAQGLTFNINGTPVTVPTGGDTIATVVLPLVDNGIVCGDGVAGLLKNCFVTVPITAGGTGATTAPAARSNLGLGTLAVQDATAVAITGGTITGMPSPSANSDVANKQYVDATATGLHSLASALYASATVLPNTPTYANGASGVGATLTAGSNAALVIDGVTVTANNRLLVKNQAAPAQNGVYTVTTVGDGSTPWVITRVTDFDTAGEMTAGSYILITSGATNSGTSWVLQTTVTTVGTTAVTWNQFSIGGVTSVNAQGGALTIDLIPGCRISLESGVAYSTADQAAKSHVYCVPVDSFTVQIYDGSNMVIRTYSAQFDITLSGTSAATAYDTYLIYDSGAVRACWGPAWTTSTDGAGDRGSGAGTAQITASVGGRWTNAVSMNCKNGGTTYTVAANQGTLFGGFKTVAGDAAYDTANIRQTWDLFRPIDRDLFQGNTASTYVLNTGLRQCNATSAGGGVPVKVQVFKGMAGWPVNLRNYSEAYSTLAAPSVDTTQNAIGLNSTSANSAQILQDGGLNNAYFQFGFYTMSEYKGKPPLGSSTFNCLESGSSANVNALGNNGTVTKQVGLIGGTWQ